MVSADGRFVVFSSLAHNLIAGQVNQNSFSNVFRYDRQADTTILISHKGGSPLVTGNGATLNPVVSADGCVVAFESTSGDLMAGPAGPPATLTQVFAYDCNANTVSLLSHTAGSPAQASNGGASLADVSADGNVILLTSTSDDLIVGGSVQGANVYAYTRSLIQVKLVTRTATSATTSANDSSGFARLSADGHFVVFGSYASDLVAGFSQPSGRHFNVFLHDLAAGVTLLVSRQNGTVTAGADGEAGTALGLSSDGRFATFASGATNLVPGQVDPVVSSDIFLFDRLSGATALVSRASGTVANAADYSSYRPMVSADGRYVVFESAATTLVPGFINGYLPGYRNVFLFDRVSGTNQLVSRAGGSSVKGADQESQTPILSDDGGRVLFTSLATDLVAGQDQATYPSSNLFLFDRAAGAARLVSHASVAALRTGNGSLSGDVALCGDGRYVAFSSYANDLVASDTNGATDAFLFGPAAPLAFHTVEPCRAADTRGADGPPVAAGATRNFALRGRCGIPISAEAVAINLTVTSPTAPGFLTLFADGQVAPTSSSMNFSPGQVRANNAIVEPGVGGCVSVRAGMASGQVEILIDVVGYFE
jgi:Tol biopolymer transport system component